MLLRKGMLVRVIKGNHKGSEGKLLYVYPKQNKAIVEGVNMVKHSVRPTQENPSGGFSEKEAPINLSNLMVIQKGQVTRSSRIFLIFLRLLFSSNGNKKLHRGIRVMNRMEQRLILLG